MSIRINRRTRPFSLSFRGSETTVEIDRRDATARSAVKTVHRRLFLAKAVKQLCCEPGGGTIASEANRVTDEGLFKDENFVIADPSPPPAAEPPPKGKP